MKSIQHKEAQDYFKKPVVFGLFGFVSWMLIFLLFDPLAGLYKIGKFDFDLDILLEPQLHIQSLLVGFLFFLFFYFTLKYKEKSSFAKIVMWLGIILYALFYIGYLFLLFFFRFTDL